MNILSGVHLFRYACTRTPQVPAGKDTPGGTRIAMKRIEAYGVVYPEGYYQALLEKYTLDGVRYPHILMILGQPRINNHFFYPHVLKGTGRLLDYGCGTGDNVRQLLRDGFSRERISAFDINREASTSVSTCTVTRRRSAISLPFQIRSHSGLRSSIWCIPLPFST